MNEDQIHVLARAVIVVEDQILLAYDPRPNPSHYYELNASFYYLPGGHIEFKESAIDAVIREIYEETGYEAKVQHFLGMLEHAWQFPNDDVCCHTHEVSLIFKVHIPGSTFQTIPPQKEEHVAFYWIPLCQINDVDFRPTPLKTLILRWMECDTINDAFQSFLHLEKF
jgi:8-oxo-dGTP diphosphatase